MAASSEIATSEIEALKAKLAATQAELKNATEKNQELQTALKSAPQLTQFEEDAIKKAQQARACEEKIRQDRERYYAVIKESNAPYYDGNSVKRFRDGGLWGTIDWN